LGSATKPAGNKPIQQKREVSVFNCYETSTGKGVLRLYVSGVVRRKKTSSDKPYSNKYGGRGKKKRSGVGMLTTESKELLSMA